MGESPLYTTHPPWIEARIPRHRHRPRLPHPNPDHHNTQNSPSKSSLSSFLASFLSFRSCFSISLFIRFCSLASSLRQQAIVGASPHWGKGKSQTKNRPRERLPTAPPATSLSVVNPPARPTTQKIGIIPQRVPNFVQLSQNNVFFQTNIPARFWVWWMGQSNAATPSATLHVQLSKKQKASQRLAPKNYCCSFCIISRIYRPICDFVRPV